jgi:polyisoprenoid-binding protein YceI
MIRLPMLCFFLLLSAASLTAEPQPRHVPDVAVTGGRIQFRVSSTFANIAGVFRTWRADLKMPADKFVDASLELQIEPGSVATGSGFKDRQARGKNFFAVNEYPEIRFVSTSITRDSDPLKFHMEGELTVRGITQPVSASITLYPAESGHQRIEGYFSFNRRQFGITHNMAFNKISNIVKVQVELDVDISASQTRVSMASLGGRR